MRWFGGKAYSDCVHPVVLTLQTCSPVPSCPVLSVSIQQRSDGKGRKAKAKAKAKQSKARQDKTGTGQERHDGGGWHGLAGLVWV
jgi:hypothetical protein